ncbi:MAG: GTP-binding protein [Granulosicoccus sp.]
MQNVIPVTIIGGYLGSGKTSLVNHLLRHANGVRLAVMVNDFGELPIDADLIEAQDNDVISLSGGCICCSYGDDLSLSLHKLQEQDSPPDHILIESSGVALPGAIGKSLSLLRAYRLEGIIVLADAPNVQSLSQQKYIGDTIARQLSDADIIVLNKLDLLTDTQAVSVRQWVTQSYANAPIIEAVYSTLDPNILFDIKRDAKSMDRIAKSTHVHDVSSVFSSINLKVEKTVDADVLAAKLASNECGLVRAKGFVMHSDNTLKTIQVVGRRWSVTDAPAGAKTGLICIACSNDLSESRLLALCGLDNGIAV